MNPRRRLAWKLKARAAIAANEADALTTNTEEVVLKAEEVITETLKTEVAETKVKTPSKVTKTVKTAKTTPTATLKTSTTKKTTAKKATKPQKATKTKTTKKTS
tara:strand:+ start:866 stop:1177 length:312 start_codon:yes stop_codon:yes gene_type:complete